MIDLVEIAEPEVLLISDESATDVVELQAENEIIEIAKQDVIVIDENAGTDVLEADASVEILEIARQGPTGASGGHAGFDVPASEALSAGMFVGLHVVSGQLRARKATNAGVPADAFVKTAAAPGDAVTVYGGGLNDAAAGLPVGELWLGTNGAAAAAPPTAVGTIVQRLGAAVSATTAQFVRGSPVTLM